MLAHSQLPNNILILPHPPTALTPQHHITTTIHTNSHLIVIINRTLYDSPSVTSRIFETVEWCICDMIVAIAGIGEF